MILQSKRVYIASAFMPAQVEVKGGKITNIYPYGTKKVDKDYKVVLVVKHDDDTSKFDITISVKGNIVEKVKKIFSKKSFLAYISLAKYTSLPNS